MRLHDLVSESYLRLRAPVSLPGSRMSRSASVLRGPFFVLTLVSLCGYFPQKHASAEHLRPPGCDKTGCYPRDPLGGFGIKPFRQYVLAYDGDHPVCSKIQNALNNAVRNGEEAERRVTHLIPLKPSIESDQDKRDAVQNGRVTTYRSQNPLFSDPIFLQLNYLGGDPVLNSKEQDRYKTNYDVEDSFAARWIILPLLNDGTPYLITESRPDAPESEEGPLSLKLVWNISPTAIPASDWSIPASYAPLQVLQVPWSAQDPSFLTDPLRRPVQLFTPLRGNEGASLGRRYADHRFPKLSVAASKIPPWIYTNLGDAVFFAEISHRYYEVRLDTRYDVILVLDAGKPPGEDVCYLYSNISSSLEKY